MAKVKVYTYSYVIENQSMTNNYLKELTKLLQQYLLPFNLNYFLVPFD